VDLEAYPEFERLRAEGRELLGEARAPGPVFERCQAARKARASLTAALEIVPDDGEAREVLDDSRDIAMRLYAAAAQEALRNQQYGWAGELYAQLKKLAPESPTVARRLTEIEQIRREGLAAAKVHLDAGVPTRAIPLLTRLQVQFPLDDEIHEQLVRCRHEVDFVVEAVRERLPALKAETHYAELLGVLRQMEATQLRLPWLPRLLARVERRIKRARRTTERAQRCLDTGRPARAQALAERALRRVADYPKARAIRDEAKKLEARLRVAREALTPMAAAGRWFRVLVLLGRFTREGVPTQEFRAARAAAQLGVQRANHFARIVLLALCGAAVWLVTGWMAHRGLLATQRLPADSPLAHPLARIAEPALYAFGVLTVLLSLTRSNWPPPRYLLALAAFVPAVAGAVTVTTLALRLTGPAVEAGAWGRAAGLVHGCAGLLATGLVGLALGFVFSEVTVAIDDRQRRRPSRALPVALGVVGMAFLLAEQAPALRVPAAALALCGLLSVGGVSGSPWRYMAVGVVGVAAAVLDTAVPLPPTAKVVAPAAVLSAGALACCGADWGGLPPRVHLRPARDLAAAFALTVGGVLLFGLAPAGSNAAVLLLAWYVCVGAAAAEERDLLDPRLHLPDRVWSWWNGGRPAAKPLPEPKYPPPPPRRYPWYLVALTVLPLGLPTLAVAAHSFTALTLLEAAGLGAAAAAAAALPCLFLLFWRSLPDTLRVAVGVVVNWAAYVAVLSLLVRVQR
jgi:hypothetical protein